jgi:hypothetical protein
LRIGETLPQVEFLRLENNPLIVLVHSACQIKDRAQMWSGRKNSLYFHCAGQGYPRNAVSPIVPIAAAVTIFVSLAGESVVARLSWTKAVRGVIPTGAVLQAKGGIWRAPIRHFTARKIPRPAGENAGLRDDFPPKKQKSSELSLAALWLIPSPSTSPKSAANY